MKLSKFNINNDINQKQKILYNSLSSGVLLLENDVTVNLEELVHQNNIDIDCNEDLIQELKRGQMIVNDDFNEIDYLILRDRAN